MLRRSPARTAPQRKGYHKDNGASVMHGLTRLLR